MIYYKMLLILRILRTSFDSFSEAWLAFWLFVRTQYMLCVHSAEKLFFFLNCCGISDSNYFQAAHHKITIKIASNDMTHFSVGLILFKKCPDLLVLLLHLNK